MVGFSEYFESVIHQKPEWRKAFIDYDKIHSILLRLGLMTHEINVKYGNTTTTNNHEAVYNNNNIVSNGNNFNNNGDQNQATSNEHPQVVAQTPSLTIKGQELLFPSSLVYGNNNNNNNNNIQTAGAGAGGSRTASPSSRVNTSTPINPGGAISSKNNSAKIKRGVPPDFTFPSNVIEGGQAGAAGGYGTIKSEAEKNSIHNNNNNNRKPFGKTTAGSTGSVNNLVDYNAAAADDGVSTASNAGGSQNTHEYHEHKHQHDRRPGHRNGEQNPDDGAFVEKNATEHAAVSQHGGGGVQFHEADQLETVFENADDENTALLPGGSSRNNNYYNSNATPGSVNNKNYVKNQSFRASRAGGGGPFYTTQTGTILNDGMVVEELFNTSGAEKAQKIKQDGFDKLHDSSKFQPASMEEIAKELWNMFKLRERAMMNTTATQNQQGNNENDNENDYDEDQDSSSPGSTNVNNNNNQNNNVSREHSVSGGGFHSKNNLSSSTDVVSPNHGPSIQFSAASPMARSASQNFLLPTSEHNNRQQLLPPGSIPINLSNNNNNSNGGEVGMGQRDHSGSSLIMNSQSLGRSVAGGGGGPRSPMLHAEQPKTGGIFPVMKRDTISNRNALNSRRAGAASNNNNNDQASSDFSNHQNQNNNNNNNTGSNKTTPDDTPSVVANKPCPVPLKFQKIPTAAATNTKNSLQPPSSANTHNAKHNAAGGHNKHVSEGSGITPSVQPLNLPPGLSVTSYGQPYAEQSPLVTAMQTTTMNNNNNNHNHNIARQHAHQHNVQSEPQTLHERRKNQMNSNGTTSTPPMNSASVGNSVLSYNNINSGNNNNNALCDRGPVGSPQLSPSMQHQSALKHSHHISTGEGGDQSGNNSMISMKTRTKFDKNSNNNAVVDNSETSSRLSPNTEGNVNDPQFPPPPQTSSLLDLPPSKNMQRQSSNASSSARQQQFQSGVSRLASKDFYTNNNNNNLESPALSHQRRTSTCSSDHNNNNHQINGSTNNMMNNQERQFSSSINDTKDLLLLQQDNNNNNNTFLAEQVTYIDVFNMCIDLIQQNAAKASHFAEVSQQQLVTYFTEHQTAWKDHGEDHDPKRAKTHLRYLHHELTALSAFVEANKLCVIKLVREFQSATDHLIIDDDEELLLAEEPDEVYETLRLEGCEDVILASIREIEAFFAIMFCDGDINSSRRLIQSKVKSPKQAFRAGFFVALCFATVLYWVHVFFELGVTSDTKVRFMQALPVIRFCHVLAVAFVCWSGVLWVFDTYSINYLYVFELDNVLSVTWLQLLEYSLFMSWLILILGILFVRSSSQQIYYASSAGFSAWTPSFIPLMFFLFLLMIAFPFRKVLRDRTRNSFFTVLWACMKMPFGYVTFVQFFVADWGTSLPTTIGDLLYCACYFGKFFGNISDVKGTDIPDMQTCVDLRGHWAFAIAMIPFYWRACQTLKMYLRTENRVHLINHGKYQSCLISMTFQTIVTFFPDNEFLVVATWFWHVFSQVYCWVWDVLMDWGWIKGRDRKMLLPKECHWAYWTAMVVDVLARLWFIAGYTKVQPVIGTDWFNVLVGDIEVARRAMWSVFRVENENTNNLETYRSIDFVPKVSLPPQDVMF